MEDVKKIKQKNFKIIKLCLINIRSNFRKYINLK